MDGKIIETKHMIPNSGLYKVRYIMKDNHLYSTSTFYNHFDKTWVETNGISIEILYEIIDNYDFNKDKFIMEIR